ncbi:MAG: insulinase family protein, partial [Bdellovibrionaceae bacterium]|nr:insulinase family protein [Pseudobdellovibrionaceae bacterium]
MKSLFFKKTQQFVSFIFILIIFFSRLSFTQTKENIKINFPVQKYSLKNGLTVLLHQDNTTPLISYHTWYKVGSRDEYQGVTGAAHMLEHMMFKGSKKYSGNEFDRILHENGIINN